MPNKQVVKDHAGSRQASPAAAIPGRWLDAHRSSGIQLPVATVANEYTADGVDRAAVRAGVRRSGSTSCGSPQITVSLPIKRQRKRHSVVAIIAPAELPAIALGTLAAIRKGFAGLLRQAELTDAKLLVLPGGEDRYLVTLSHPDLEGDRTGRLEVPILGPYSSEMTLNQWAQAAYLLYAGALHGGGLLSGTERERFQKHLSAAAH